MRLLLDTHIALWAIVDSPRLSATARELIGDESNELLVSSASVWEIAIKRPLKRASSVAIEQSATEALEKFEAAGFAFLPITVAHARLVEALPLHHGDPFDRLLIAQALDEPLRLVTHDATLQVYSDTIIIV